MFKLFKKIFKPKISSNSDIFNFLNIAMSKNIIDKDVYDMFSGL